MKRKKYYKGFAGEFPEKTLSLFRKAVDDYAAQNVGRTSYYQIASHLILMTKIKGGKKVVSEMIEHYKVCYKNRRAMLDELKRVSS